MPVRCRDDQSQEHTLNIARNVESASPAAALDTKSSVQSVFKSLEGAITQNGLHSS